MSVHDTELAAWAAEWQAQAVDADRAADVRRRVRRRSALLTAWVAGEAVVALAALVFLVHRVVTQPDPLERLAMALLAAVVAAAGVFGFWNWRGVVAPPAGPTSVFLELSIERGRRLERAVRAGWWLLAGQAAVFLPWTALVLFGDAGAPPDARRVQVVGLFLALMFGAAAAGLVWLGRWARRESRLWTALARDLGDERPPDEAR